MRFPPACTTCLQVGPDWIYSSQPRESSNGVISMDHSCSQGPTLLFSHGFRFWFTVPDNCVSPGTDRKYSFPQYVPSFSLGYSMTTWPCLKCYNILIFSCSQSRRARGRSPTHSQSHKITLYLFSSLFITESYFLIALCSATI